MDKADKTIMIGNKTITFHKGSLSASEEKIHSLPSTPKLTSKESNIMSDTASNNHDTITSSLINNVMHAIKLGTLTTLAISTQQTLPVINNPLHFSIPLALFGINLANDIYNAGELGNNKAAVVDLRHSAVSDSLVNAGIAIASAFLVKHKPELALPMIGIVTIADIALSGENSPIEYLKDGMNHLMDYVYHA